MKRTVNLIFCVMIIIGMLILPTSAAESSSVQYVSYTVEELVNAGYINVVLFGTSTQKTEFAGDDNLLAVAQTNNSNTYTVSVADYEAGNIYFQLRIMYIFEFGTQMNLTTIGFSEISTTLGAITTSTPAIIDTQKTYTDEFSFLTRLVQYIDIRKDFKGLTYAEVLGTTNNETTTRNVNYTGSTEYINSRTKITITRTLNNQNITPVECYGFSFSSYPMYLTFREESNRGEELECDFNLETEGYVIIGYYPDYSTLTELTEINENILNVYNEMSEGNNIASEQYSYISEMDDSTAERVEELQAQQKDIDAKLENLSANLEVSANDEALYNALDSGMSIINNVSGTVGAGSALGNILFSGSLSFIPWVLCFIIGFGFIMFILYGKRG